MASEAAAAWKAAEAGQVFDQGAGTYFRDWSALRTVLTPKRYELLQHLRREPETGVRSLARALERDVKRVHEDVVALAEIGLVRRDDSGGLWSDVDEIVTTIRMSPPREVPHPLFSDESDRAETTVDQARRALEGIRGVHVAATLAAGGTDVERDAERLGAGTLDLAESDIRNAFELASMLVGAQSPEEVTALQIDYARTRAAAVQEQARAHDALADSTREGVARPARSPAGRRRRDDD